MVFSKISIKDWTNFKFHALPKGSAWVKSPSGRVQFMDSDEAKAITPRLLHAFWDGKELRINGDFKGKTILQLKISSQKKSGIFCLFFRKQLAILTPNDVHRLWRREEPPYYLEWKGPKMQNWEFIPINRDLFLSSSDQHIPLVDLLYFKYSGKQFPDSHSPKEIQRGIYTEGNAKDELELIKSEHQGELDELILKWRSVIRRIRMASKNKPEQYEQRLKDVKDLLELEAQRYSREWPSHRLDYIKSLLEGACPKLK